MATPRKIALCFSIAMPHQARFLRGVTEYAAGHTNWTFVADVDRSHLPIRSLLQWPVDGVFATIETPKEAEIARRLGVPCVNLSGAQRETVAPRVMVDQRMIGQMAADHLLARRFQRFAFCGIRGLYYSELRQQGFSERIRQYGSEPSIFKLPRSFATRRPWYHQLGSLERWLKTLQPPVGLMVVHDYRACVVEEACLRLGIRVPNDVAIVGTDNEEISCELARVPISSVARNDVELGRRAAQLLDGMIRGKKPPRRDVLIPPLGVRLRASSDIFAVEDRKFGDVLAHIRHHATEPISVKTVVQKLKVSRRWLETHFQEHLEMTPHEYITRLRVNQAKKLLTSDRSLPLGQIAQRSGFSGTRMFREAFTRIEGISPAQYRTRKTSPADA